MEVLSTLPDKIWQLHDADASEVKELQESLKIHPLLCRLLITRGIKTYAEAKDFFRPEKKHLHSPWLMKDMHKAVARIEKTISQKEKILICGDYDVDGTTSIATLYLYLKHFHQQVDFYLPNRYTEGYGLSKKGIDFAKENNFTLIISVDCGIKSADLVAYAANLGIDFIICDHHLPDEKIPPAIAILNAKQIDCHYPYQELCGCGVAFKLMQALGEKLQLPEEWLYENIDLVATAIAADIVPITGENRVLAYMGLEKVNSNPNIGIKALSELSKMPLPIHITNLVFLIAPRVNAAGRMGDARKAVEMFVAPSYQEAMLYAEMLHADNTDRKETDKSITQEAITMLTAQEDWEKKYTTVLYAPHWHKGVVGIVASRVIEFFYRPTIILTQGDGVWTGSARSIPGFNVYEAIHACNKYLLGYGGHFAAAGLTIPSENIDEFINSFEKVVSETIDKTKLVPILHYDAELPLKDITPTFFKIIKQMEPYGPQNMEPVFCCKQVVDTGYSRIVKEDHIKFSIRQFDTVVNGIGFGLAEKFSLLENNKLVDILFRIDENEWNNQKTIQIKVLDIRAS